MGRIALLALAAFAVLALCINAIAINDHWWVIALTIGASILIFCVIGFEVRHLMEDDDDGADRPRSAGGPTGDGAPIEPGTAFTGMAGDTRAVVVTTEPAGPADVLPALGIGDGAEDAGKLSVMVVVPEGIGHVNYDDEHYYVEARHAEAETVGALRRAGVAAAGHVGDHDAAQAISDALALFPAPRVVVLAGASDAAKALRREVDPATLGRRTGAVVEFVELRPGRVTP